MRRQAQLAGSLIPAVALGSMACGGPAPNHQATQRAAAPAEATPLLIGVDFRGPESVRYDPDQDVFFISNVNGGMSSKDGNGFIMRVSAARPDTGLVFVRSGQGGVVLNAPKGLAIVGDTLWVTDIDVVWGFDRHTGAPVAMVDLRPLSARFLNDIAAAPDGSLWLTDTGIEVDPRGRIPVGGDRIFRIGAGHAVTVVAEGDSLHEPNGITWDAARRKWVVLPFQDLQSYIFLLDSTGMTRLPVMPGRGQFDGVEALPGRKLLVSSWGDSAVYLVTDSSSRRLLTGLVQPADIGVDTKRGVLAVPLPNRDEVQYWKLSLR
jgi:hypothetical protein